MSREVRNGKYVVFHGSTYLRGYECPTEGMVNIISENRDDLQNGFIPINVEYNQKNGYFQCQKEVPKSEITQAYEITTYADYRGFRLFAGQKPDNVLQLVTAQVVSHNDYKTQDILEKNGFTICEIDKTYFAYEKNVPIDDPEPQLFEERKEIDISNW